MDNEVAIALISAGAALAGGLIGGGISHFTTLRSHRLQADEDHLRHRQGVYHDFLDASHAFMQAAGGVDDLEVPEWRSWFRWFEHCLSAVHLFGSEDSRVAAQRLADLFGQATDIPDGANSESAIQAYQAVEDQVLDAWDKAVEAMREDVGPGA